MDQIQHKFVQVQGLKHHVAEIGAGPKVVVFLHGFPEIWYSWRHQMICLARSGFRAIAPDYRGYGLSDPPPVPEKTTFGDLISDLLAILDFLEITKVVLVAKDFGAKPAYMLALLHPERVLGVVTMGVPFIPPGPSQYQKHLPEGFYISRWREPGRAEADFGRLDAKKVVRNIYILFSRSEIPIAAENQEIMDLVDLSTPLPPWFTEEDLATYGALYEKSGFQTALQVPYRSLDEDLNITEPVVEAPALLIMGDKDYVFKFPGMEDYIKSGKVKEFVPDLDIIYLPEGSHFVQEQSPDECVLISNGLKRCNLGTLESNSDADEDAKDAFVSLWHFIADLERSRNVEPLSLDEAFELFCSGISSYGPYWDHVLGYWRASLEFPEKILFLTYEEMKKDTASHVKKLAEFMGCSFTLEEEEEGEVQKIISMCSFEKLSNLEVNKNGKHRADTSFAMKNSVFFRKGEIGDWANNLTAEMGARLDDIMEQKLKGSGLKLPR
ncbi:hypothetical protein DKX38_017066 [Salix brachista]|uniref:Sulfotransferase n=1 Tax=Salix brachista TaxID=2182728 RepID=A0A5N5KU67_9ROSI|nr:hypothetical protein DKX38_017066 [Salix brachista]